MKIVAVLKFQTPYGEIEFWPVTDVPGHTHRVAVDRQWQKLWLPTGMRANKKAAKFFIRVFRAMEDGLPKYHYADRNEDPPLPSGSGRECATGSSAPTDNGRCDGPA